MPYCIDIILLILILFSLVNNSLCVIMPKALLNSEEIKSSELSLSRKVFIFSKKKGSSQFGTIYQCCILSDFPQYKSVQTIHPSINPCDSHSVSKTKIASLADDHAITKANH